MVKIFEDANGNAEIDPGEKVSSSMPLCNGVSGLNGANGSTGVDGVAGINGQNGVDGTNGVNGQDGVNGQNGADGRSPPIFMGAVGSLLSDPALSAGRHDYLYLPNMDAPARGWLLFRHQANGTKDDGAASTGFQVWNTDISDFHLVSEKEGTVYCKMQWNADEQLLSFEVLYPDDGLQGEKGELLFR